MNKAGTILGEWCWQRWQPSCTAKVYATRYVLDAVYELHFNRKFVPGDILGVLTIGARRITLHLHGSAIEAYSYELSDPRAIQQLEALLIRARLLDQGALT